MTQYPQNQQYQQSQQNQSSYYANYSHEKDETVSVGEWLTLFLLAIIPIIYIIMMFVWGFGDSTKPSKANYCKAVLIMMAIGMGIFLLIALFGGLLAACM